jgi:hypothetical protein
MPKRWRAVESDSWTWQLVFEPDADDEDQAVRVLAQSHERWRTEEEALRAIDQIKELETPSSGGPGQQT